MQTHSHPYENAEYTLLASGEVRVVNNDTGQEGVFAVGGRWVRGELRCADNHFIRYVYDHGERIRAIAPGLSE